MRANTVSQHPRRAFTLVELLVAMSILAILLGLLFVAGNKLFKTNKEGATKVTLGVLKGMLAELDAKTRLSTPPLEWVWLYNNMPTLVGPGRASLTPPKDPFPSTRYTGDFWHIPFEDISTNPVTYYPLDAPGMVSNTTPGSLSGNARFASRQVLNTQLAMNVLYSYPSNASALEQIPPDRYFVPEYTGGDILTPDSTTGVLYYLTAGTDLGAKETVLYPLGAKVQYQGKKYVCVNPDGSPSAGVPGSAPSTPAWAPYLGGATPILLDAWNNPIIFVPATGLRVRKLNGNSVNEPNDQSQTFIIVSPEGKVARTNPNDPASAMKIVQPGRPFFASAGADGDFAKGDDNIYSFEP